MHTEPSSQVLRQGGGDRLTDINTDVDVNHRQVSKK